VISRRGTIVSGIAVGAASCLPVAIADQRPRLASAVARMPPEGQAFFNALGPWWWDNAEHVLNIVGEDSFVTYWQHQRDEIVDLSLGFGPELDAVNDYYPAKGL
jgi:hypothetical protein